MLDDFISSFIILWAVIDPIGTVPVFIAVTKGYNPAEKKQIASYSSIVAFVILLLFMFIGEFILKQVGVPLSAFQVSGGIILFLFALNMIFGDSKPEEEIQLVKKTGDETAIFPLAIPSIAGPGAILAVVLLSESHRGSMNLLLMTIFVLIIVLLINFTLMRMASKIHNKIGNSGAIVVSKIMGLILASMAANNILIGLKEYFKL